MAFNMEEVKAIVEENFNRAKRKLSKSFVMDSIKMAEPISDVIKGYSSK